MWIGRGAWLVVSPAERATRRSVTHGVTNPPRSLCRAKDRCVRGMRPVRGISNRAPHKPQSRDQSVCVRRRVVSRAGVFTRSVSQIRLRTPGTHRSYERALLYRMPNGVPHVIASTQHASLNQSDKIGRVKSDLRVYAIRIVFILPNQSKSDLCTY